MSLGYPGGSTVSIRILKSETLSQLWLEKNIAVEEGSERGSVARFEDGGRGNRWKLKTARNGSSPSTSRRKAVPPMPRGSPGRPVLDF